MGDDIPALAQTTLEIMRQGVRMIYQGVLLQGDMVGRPDLIARREGRSRLGSHFYFPIEIKNASGYEDRERRRRKKKYGLQLAYYGRVLEAVQGVLPAEGQVIDLNKEVVVFPIGEYLAELDALLPHVRRLVLGEEQDGPALIGGCANCQWRAPCRQWLEANQDITLVPGISRSHKEKLVTIGINKMTDPLSWNRPRVLELHGIGPASVQNWERQAHVLQSGKIEVLQRLSLPAVELEVFFDVENDPTQQLVYLFGLGTVEVGGALDYASFWADSRNEEEAAWRQLLAWFEAILPRKPVIYHYSAHEKTMNRELARRHSFTPTRLIQELETRMQDLHTLVKDSVVLPVRSYGLKEVARHLGFRYTDPEAGGAESIYWFNQYQDDPVVNAAYKSRLLTYNREDCLAMAEVLRFLKGL